MQQHIHRAVIVAAVGLSSFAVGFLLSDWKSDAASPRAGVLTTEGSDNSVQRSARKVVEMVRSERNVFQGILLPEEEWRFVRLDIIQPGTGFKLTKEAVEVLAMQGDTADKLESVIGRVAKLLASPKYNKVYSDNNADVPVATAHFRSLSDDERTAIEVMLKTEIKEILPSARGDFFWTKLLSNAEQSTSLRGFGRFEMIAVFSVGDGGESLEWTEELVDPKTGRRLLKKEWSGISRQISLFVGTMSTAKHFGWNAVYCTVSIICFLLGKHVGGNHFSFERKTQEAVVYGSVNRAVPSPADGSHRVSEEEARDDSLICIPPNLLYKYRRPAMNGPEIDPKFALALQMTNREMSALNNLKGEAIDMVTRFQMANAEYDSAEPNKGTVFVPKWQAGKKKENAFVDSVMSILGEERGGLFLSNSQGTLRDRLLGGFCTTDRLYRFHVSSNQTIRIAYVEGRNSTKRGNLVFLGRQSELYPWLKQLMKPFVENSELR